MRWGKTKIGALQSTRWRTTCVVHFSLLHYCYYYIFFFSHLFNNWLPYYYYYTSPIEVSRSLTPPTGGGSTCTKVVLGGRFTYRPPAIRRPAGRPLHGGAVPPYHGCVVRRGVFFRLSCVRTVVPWSVHYHPTPSSSAVFQSVRETLRGDRPEPRKFNSI